MSSPYALPRIRSRIPGLSQWQRQRQKRGQLQQKQGRIRTKARVTVKKKTPDAKGCTKEVLRCVRRVSASLEGKNSDLASATLAVEIILREIAPQVEEKEDLGHWKPGRLGKNRHWQNTHVFCHRYERRMQVHSECRES